MKLFNVVSAILAATATAAAAGSQEFAPTRAMELDQPAASPGDQPAVANAAPGGRPVLPAAETRAAHIPDTGVELAAAAATDQTWPALTTSRPVSEGVMYHVNASSGLEWLVLAETYEFQSFRLTHHVQRRFTRLRTVSWATAYALTSDQAGVAPAAVGGSADGSVLCQPASHGASLHQARMAVEGLETAKDRWCCQVASNKCTRMAKAGRAAVLLCRARSRVCLPCAVVEMAVRELLTECRYEGLVSGLYEFVAPLPTTIDIP